MKATKLAKEDSDGSSHFSISTDDTNASVRGTIFKIRATSANYTRVSVYA